MAAPGSLSAAPSPVTACLTSFGEYSVTSHPRRGLGHGDARGLADRHGGAHVDLEQDPLDGHHRGELGEQRPQLGLELGQALGHGRSGRGAEHAEGHGPRPAPPAPCRAHA
jgi:hypothetical protein